MTDLSTSTAVPKSAWLLVTTRGISSLGSTLTSFGLNVWIFRHTGSFPIFALLNTLAGLPEILFAPIAGLITDRYSKKLLLLAADILSAAMVIAVWLASVAGVLDVAVVAVTLMVLGLTSELRWSALSPAISELVPKSALARVNGLQQSFRGINVMLGPLLGAFGLAALGLDALLALDILSYALGIVGILGIPLAAVPQRDNTGTKHSGFWQEVTFGFRWVFARAGLRRLLLFFMLINVSLSIYVVTAAPYILSFGDNRNLGFTLGLEGAGGFLAGLYLAKRRMSINYADGVLGAAICIAMCLFAWGMVRSLEALCAVAFAMGIATAFLAVCSQTIWQAHVPIGMQGKVFAVRTVVAYGLTPLATLSSIPLANYAFGPATEQVALVQALWGTHLTGALGALVSASGLLIALVAGGLWIRGGLRISDDPLPSATAETA
jgi:MFS transporter, DHA3 family, macrolide efflux protein